MSITGVISNNNINWEFVNDEICLTCNEIMDKLESEMNEEEYQTDIVMVECDSSHTKIFGDWVKGSDGKYEPDKTKEFSAIMRESVTQVVWSKFIASNKKMCSPCYPGQADLDSVGGNNDAYTLPEDMITGSSYDYLI